MKKRSRSFSTLRSHRWGSRTTMRCHRLLRIVKKIELDGPIIKNWPYTKMQIFRGHRQIHCVSRYIPLALPLTRLASRGADSTTLHAGSVKKLRLAAPQRLRGNRVPALCAFRLQNQRLFFLNKVFAWQHLSHFRCRPHEHYFSNAV